jgi:hypothetical protein
MNATEMIRRAIIVKVRVGVSHPLLLRFGMVDSLHYYVERVGQVVIQSFS